LTTADGLCWQFCGKNEDGALLILRLAHALRLGLQTAAVFAARKTRPVKKISVSVSRKEIRWSDMPGDREHEITCHLGPVSTPEKMVLQLTRISQIVASASEKYGGLLVHGALAEWNNIGVILAGPGGVGKTTASKRLPLPWRSLCDDVTLIVKAQDGTYWAHPWPTWSQYRQGDLNGSWDVQSAVKIGLICMLSRNIKDRVFQLPIRQAISELVDVSGQTFFIMANGMDKDAIRRLNLVRFYNAVAISQKIPVCRLDIGLKGNFWDEIEGFLHESEEMAKIKK
jgi:SynChlorMet cassette protein ScmC